MAHLFVLDIIYTQGTEAVDPHLEAHRQYLTRNYKNGSARNEISEVVTEDPFIVNGVAEYTITEFIPTMTSPHLENYRENL